MNDTVETITFTWVGGKEVPDVVVLVMKSGRRVVYRR